MAVAYKNAKLVDIGVAMGDAYVVPAATTAIVKAIHVSNKDATTDQVVNAQWTDASAADAAVSIAEGHVVPLKASYQLLDGPLVLEAGDKIRLSAGVAAKLDATISALEMS